ncbi:hypothetical protein Phum_PHUM293950 [Pediculus humanus corporis]|uniref:Uncharacterized protein n=1 Tax=Pediculus humanus subsp. corporis TaxID=121224 RepID=E0VLT9_PEDHC|nr:uncharacterized protein Phum_PHUM293950 [Pediculus humanus corporis]EEB14345.1 hypothetical protein Phum_PHUM293950 [Pediculus humanus corporis]
MVDLTTNSKKKVAAVLRSNLFETSNNFETSRSSTNLYSEGQQYPVVTGVSVQELVSSRVKFAIVKSNLGVYNIKRVEKRG